MSTLVASSPVASFGKVGVLFGGRSAERQVSIMSGTRVLQALRDRGVDAHPFDPAVQTLAQLEAQKFDRVFIALHGRYGEDGSIQGALEQLGVPYTGPGVLASAIAMDKGMTKRVWQAEGLPTPQFQMLTAGFDAAQIIASLSLPLIVKPAHEGSTLGLTKVSSADQLPGAYALAARFDRAVMAEQFIDGMELTCPILGYGGHARALPLVRIEAPNANYDYQNKYFTDATRYFCPSGLAPEREREIQQLALAIHRALGCRGWSRVDVMVRAADDAAYLLELNTSPGMTGHSLVPMSARAIGLEYDDLCLEILASAALDLTPLADWQLK
jgi:D-alanine-D-alanine ligase